MPSLPPSPDKKPPPLLGPGGVSMRDMAIQALRVNLDGLLERSRKRMLTPVERAEVERLTLTIDTLQSMGAA